MTEKTPMLTISYGDKIPRPTHALAARINRAAMETIGHEIVFSIRKMTVRERIFAEEKALSVQSNGIFRFSANSKEEAEALIGKYELEKDGDDYFLQKID